MKTFENIISDIQVLKEGTSKRKNGKSSDWILRALISEEENDRGQKIKYTTFDNYFMTPEGEKVMITDAIIGTEVAFCYEVNIVEKNGKTFENRKIITNPASPLAIKEDKLDRILKGLTIIHSGIEGLKDGQKIIIDYLNNKK